MAYPHELTGTLLSEYPVISGELDGHVEEMSGTLSSSDSLDGNLGDRQIMTINDYEKLDNIPSIEGVPLIGDKTFTQLHMSRLTNTDIEALLQ